MGALNAEVWGLIPHGDLFGTWVFGKKNIFCCVNQVVIEFSSRCQGVYVFSTWKKIILSKFCEKI